MRAWSRSGRLPREVLVSGTGPAVIVMAEMPGIGPHVLRFARWVRDAGLTVYLPSLFGRDGAVPDAAETRRLPCRLHQRRISVPEHGEPSPVSNWLRQLARLAHDECGGPGVGAIGMCFTGNFAVSLLIEPSVVAAVVAQPALPLDNPSQVAFPQRSWPLFARVSRLRHPHSCVSVRWRHFCRAERFAAYAEALGPRFESHVLPEDSANRDVPPFTAAFVPTPHSVFTAHLIDKEGEPTLKARDEVIEYFARLCCSELSRLPDAWI